MLVRRPPPQRPPLNQAAVNRVGGCTEGRSQRLGALAPLMRRPKSCFLLVAERLARHGTGEGCGSPLNLRLPVGR